MAVTKLERKGRKNKTVAKVRVATIKRLKSKITIGSGYKEESGHVVGDVQDVLKDIQSQPKPEPKKEVKADKAEKTEKVEKTPEAKKEVTEEKKEKKAPAKKPAAKKPAAKKADADKKPAAKKAAPKAKKKDDSSES